METTQTTSTESPNGGRSLFVAIVEQVAELRDLDPLEMPSLSDTLDLDALDRLFEPDSGTDPDWQGRLVFDYADCLVTVHADGSVTVLPAADSRVDDGR